MTVAAISMIPAIIGWCVYSHYMRAAARSEVERSKEHPGQDTVFSSEWVSHWTRLGMLWGGSSFATMFIGLFATGEAEAPRGQAVGLVILMLLLLIIVGGLSGGAIAQRSIRMLEPHGSDLEHQIGPR